FILLATLTLPGTAAWAQLPSFRSEKDLADYLRTVRCASTVQVTQHERATPGAIVFGRMTDNSGTAIPGARVAMSPIGVSTVTSSDGRYQVRVLPESLPATRNVVLSATTIGHEPVQRPLRVRPRDSLEVNVSLCEATTELAALTVDGAVVTGVEAARVTGEGITNTQHAGVDEGGIVKLHGDHLVILRRGRLFTVAIGDDRLKPIAAVDAFGPGIDPRGTWYDELLIAGDRVVVVGYSYQRGGTELGVFAIDAAGGLKHHATYQLRSHDYYSSRNYASRLIGSKLVYYTPLFLPYGLNEPLSVLPSMRRWSRSADSGGRFERIVTPQRVYHPEGWKAADQVALHTVTVCDLAAADLTCEATVVIGPAGRVFYVSPEAVYVWMSDWARFRARTTRQAILCRMPLDGSTPSALGVTGTPVDQFSFLESEDDHVNVLVRSDAGGDFMWSPERAAGSVSLLRAPLSAFNDGNRPAPSNMYRALPSETGGTFHNRFVGDFLLYGNGSGWGRATADGSILYVVPWRRGKVRRLLLPHGTDRIEVMGRDAVVVGADQRDLHFTGIRLDGTPEVAQHYTLRDASQGELRSHGFFYKADGAHSGVLGLPVRGPGRPGYEHLFRESASILFLDNRDGQFRSLGNLGAEPETERPRDDNCKASCVDWYGNARPLFIQDRIFALLGYEIVEGRIDLGQIAAVRRVSFSPSQVSAVRH
ncbi:MAG TPA: beta-propeller domain-containing protein, partial [Gemmatimonadales bacterium]|nr:beta-propeller domain-containing protein [Gemmatimonadales bacterium]